MGNASVKRDLEYLQALSAKAQEESFTLPEDDAARLIGALKSGKSSLQEWAANTISFLCKDNAENRDIIVQHGGLKYLIYRLKRSKDKKTRCWSVCALGNLCIDNEKNQNQVLEAGGIKYVVKLLRARDSKLQRWAANAIGIISTENERVQEAVFREGGVSLLTALLCDKKNKDVAHWSLFALGNLCCIEECQLEMVKKGAVPALIEVLDHNKKKDNERKRWAANILALLSLNNASVRKMVADMNGIQILIGLIKNNKDPNVVLNASMALGNMCLDNEYNRKLAQELGGLTMLVNIIQTKNSKDRKLQNAAAVAVINIVESADDLPLNVHNVIKRAREGVRKEEVGSQLINLIDGSNTVAMRLRKRAPALSASALEDLRKEKTEPDTFSDGDELDTKSRGHSEESAAEKSATETPRSHRGHIEKEKGKKEKEGDSENEYEREEKEFVLQSDVEYDNLAIQEEIAVGSFGAVYKGLYKGKPVAIKEMFFSENEAIRKLIDREVQALKALDHPNIVKYMGLCCHATGTFLVTQYIDGGDLRGLLKSNEYLSWMTRISIAHDIATAVEYVHSKGIIHRDLKSKNVLLTSDRHALLCDFGFAREKPTNESSLTLRVGTNEWMAPEVIMGSEYDQAADVFSYGLLLYEIMTRDKPPVDRNYVFDPVKFEAIIKVKMEISKTICGAEAEAMIALASRCVASSPFKRPTLHDINEYLLSLMKK